MTTSARPKSPTPRIPTPSAATPSRRARLVAALAIGLLAGWFAAHSARFADLEFWWRGARLLAEGADPYAGRPNTPAWPLPDRLFYPLPTLLVTLPVAWMPLPAAAAVSVGGVTAALVYVLARAGWWRLVVCTHPSFLWSVYLGQWTLLLTLCILVPALAWLAPVKPTLGAATYAWRVDVRGALGGLAFTLASVAVRPSWPAAWLANLETVVSHPAPILTPLGALVACGIIRWRQPEARLLVAMACVPQLLFWGDQLPLTLVARTLREQLALGLCGAMAWLVWGYSLRSGDLWVPIAAQYVVVGCYLPALLLVLRRPNTGKVPEWVERGLVRLRIPAWLRGRAASDAEPTP